MEMPPPCRREPDLQPQARSIISDRRDLAISQGLALLTGAERGRDGNGPR